MEPVINSLLPSGTIDGYAAHTPTAKQCLEKAVEVVKAECAQAETADKANLLDIAERVDRLCAIFSALQISNDDETQQCNVLPSDANTSVQKVVGMFGSLIIEEDTLGRTAFERGDLSMADRCFTKLSQAMKYHIGSDRDYYIRACRLATSLESCRRVPLLTRADASNSPLERNNEALTILAHTVTTYKGLQSEVIPKTLTDWNGNIGTAIKKYVTEQLAATGEAVKAIWEDLSTRSKTIERILTAEKLQGISNFQPLLNELLPIQTALQLLSNDLDMSLSMRKELCTHCKALGMENGTNHEDVKAMMDKWKALTSSAIELLGNLNKAQTTEEKNKTLIEWIAKHIEAYSCKADALSALHSWAFSLLGKLFTSQQLSQQALDSAVTLLRQHASKLLTHARALLVDVALQYGNENSRMNHLLLGALSSHLQTACCTPKQITAYHKTWREFPCFGPRIEQVRQWWNKGEAHIVLNLQLEEEEEQAILVKRAQMMHSLLEALQNNDYTTLEEVKDAETLVTLFEDADILKMPPEIIRLSIHKLDTYAFRQNLTALLWVRHAQTRGIELPYIELNRLFSSLSGKEFLKWISLYKPDRIKINPKNHHLLFSAVAETATRLLLDDQSRLTDQQIEKIAQFVADRYEELVKVNTDPIFKHNLDTQFIHLICLCLTRVKNVAPYRSLAVLKDVVSLRTASLEPIKGRFTPAVIEWLEQVIYPNLLLLELHEGMDSVGLGNFKLCTALTGLSTPLPSVDTNGKIRALAQICPKISMLILKDGNIDPSVLDSFPLLQELRLYNIKDELNFTACANLRSLLTKLELGNVAVQENSLSWIASCENMVSLSIQAQQGSKIGSLATAIEVHRRNNFTTLRLQVDSFDQDPELVASLPRLLSSCSTISDVTLKGACTSSLLGALLQGRQNDQDRQIETLGITWDLSEDPAKLAQFHRLKTVHCYSSRNEVVQKLQAYKFAQRTALEQWMVIYADGIQVPIPVKMEE